ncbi:hypothetical protein [Singulisphaera acidiphila]|uniref:Uncharacterized protein n=1 Tax=Singulisphaera acidiphila (strain ATCC BAA-1392 / DSM 18658 / VKM B-2454 / MOB10) TaxID=886293 RepID=L0DFE2_SINAD|nr:hypothetical protein [Singulisphaera acidiphila]AGA28104.1 hypothetical protein Sinac_3875 [Singulisphaera acidiphila DSM 18658]
MRAITVSYVHGASSTEVASHQAKALDWELLDRVLPHQALDEYAIGMDDRTRLQAM